MASFKTLLEKLQLMIFSLALVDEDPVVIHGCSKHKQSATARQRPTTGTKRPTTRS